MNIQIFGKNKCFGTKNAQRFFKERQLKFQLIDVLDKGLSARELDSVVASIKNIDLLFDRKSTLYESLNIAYITRTVEDKKALLLAHPSLLVTPIVRDCDTKVCTVGIQEDVWKKQITK